MPTGDIVIHIDETLNDDRIQSLEREMGDTRGVQSACMHERTRHLMIVDFDPTALRPSAIVTSIRKLGLHAQMVGM